ncbi:MAG: hypothetical protein HY597_01000 [Candidatus Omnitrophica bacterium]|nr:hypothetical protein [Candidatus Omnitrophota bacterium]
MTQPIVIIGNHPQRIVQAAGRGRSLRYLLPVETPELRRVAERLEADGAAQEVPRASWHGQRAEFRRQYIACLGAVNRRHRSPAWWARTFTTKHALSSPLCRQMFTCWLAAQVMRRDPASSMVVLTDDAVVASALARWARPAGWRCVTAVRQSGGVGQRLRRSRLCVFTVALLRFLRVWWATRHLRPRGSGDEHVILLSLIHPRYSWTADGRYQDAYFGRLVDYLGTRQPPTLILGVLDGAWWENPQWLKRLDGPVPVVPVPACVTWPALVRSMARTLRAFGYPETVQRSVKLDDMDLTTLVEHAMRDPRQVGQYLLNLTVEEAVRFLARRLRVSRCIYPYENRAFEKLALLAFREVSPHTRLIGYQHASISHNHPNLFFAEGEAAATPLPDVIITMGEITRHWLEQEGRYPPGLLRAGCALRQRTLERRPEPKSWSRPVRHLLAALATGGWEYARTLEWLQEVAAEPSYQVRVRPHPGIPLDEAFRIAPVLRRDFFSVSSGSLEDDLRWADVVLYASSTAGLEAMAWGLPVVYLDLGGAINSDPIVGGAAFKWSAATPEQLREMLDAIGALSEDEAARQRALAGEYAARYLRPVTTDRLQAFVEV